MNLQPEQPNIRIVLKDSHKRHNLPDPNESVVWHPLDRLGGYAIIQSASPLTFDKVQMRLEGHSRVWITAIDRDDEISTAKSSYKVLFQSHEVKDIGHVKHKSPELSGYILPFSFVIARWALVKDKVSNQCLNLPPSISVGQTLPGSKEPEVYAQPNISYHIKALVQYRFTNKPEAQTLEAWKEIRIIPVTESLPPTDTQDFAAEFVESQNQKFRTSVFLGPTYLMTLSMTEPPAIIVQDMRMQGTTSAELIVDIRAAEGNIDETSVGTLSQRLRKLTFHVEPVFRAKTFYSTIPFAKLPGQTMLTLKGLLRIRDEVMKLKPLAAKMDSWQCLSQNGRPSYAEAVRRASSRSVGSGNGSAASSCGTSSNPPRSWSARIHVPIVVTADLPPTFCSALASKQYSVIVRTQVGGLKIKPFILEVPIQLIYSPPEALMASLGATCSPNGALDVENLPEDLPSYS